VVFDVPTLRDNWSRSGQAQVSRERRGGSNSGLVSLLLVLGLLAFLLFQGKGSNQDAVNNVFAEAVMQSNDVPGVRISWTRDSFFRGNNSGPVYYQVWRNGVNNVPVAVVPGTQANAIDDTLGSDAPVEWYDFGGIIGGSRCDNPDLPGTDPDPVPPVVAGTPYRYGVEVVYRVSSLDLPGGDTGGTGGTGGSGGLTTGGGTTGGTTGGGNTGGNTGGTTGGTTGGNTGGNTGGTTGSGAEFCYFVSPRVPTQGTATPLVRPSLRSPDNDAVVNVPIAFQFTSVRGPVASLQLEYVLQVSDRPNFPRDRTITLDPFVEQAVPGGGTVSTSVYDTSTFFPGSTLVYWRIGARALGDEPGPVADASGQRYIFSGVRRFRRTPPPGNGPGRR
jgi:hypothetical protein